jgi:Escherichia/Staphylococcus phage prohead protease
MRTQKKEVRFQAELRKAKSGGRTLSGYAARFNQNSLPIPGAAGPFIEQLAPGCFSDALAAGDEIRALMDHDHTKILARRSNGSLRIAEDNLGLAVELDVPRTSYADDLLALVDSGLIAGMSFSLYCIEDRWSQITVDGQVWALRTVLRADLDEVTATSVPAYPSTSLAASRSYFPDGLPASVELRTASASASTTEHLGVVPFASYAARSEDPYSSVDEANGIIAWADGEDEDRSADAPVKNKLKAAQGFLYVKNAGEKRSDYIGPHHTVRDGALAHSQIGTLRVAQAFANGKLDIPSEHRAAVKDHLDSEMNLWFGDGNSDEDDRQVQRLKLRRDNLFQ